MGNELGSAAKEDEPTPASTQKVDTDTQIAMYQEEVERAILQAKNYARRNNKEAAMNCLRLKTTFIKHLQYLELDKTKKICEQQTLLRMSSLQLRQEIESANAATRTYLKMGLKKEVAVYTLKRKKQLEKNL